MAFIAKWSNMGSPIKDLLNKRYDYKNELVVKDTAQNVEVEAAITQAHNSFNGKVKATQKHKGFEIEHAVSTNRNGPMFSSKLKTAKFYDGVTFLLGGTTAPNFHVGVECEKGDAQQSISSTLTTEMGRHATAAEGTIMRRVGGLSSGVQVKYCTAHGFVEFNTGIEYSHPDWYAFTLKTTNNAHALEASYWHNLPVLSNRRKTQVGGEAKWSFEDDATLLTVGVEHDIAQSTTVKSKVDTNGRVAGVFEHRFPYPSLKLDLSAEWHVKKQTAMPKQFGVALTFGDD